jgi:hypothetical protein
MQIVLKCGGAGGVDGSLEVAGGGVLREGFDATWQEPLREAVRLERIVSGGGGPCSLRVGDGEKRCG